MSDPSSPAPRQTKRFEQKRGAILDAAAKRFNERGIRGTSLADVSGSVGLMTNSITYYYRRKEDLAAACFLAKIAWLDALIAEAEAAPDPEARLRLFLDRYCRGLAAMATGERPALIRFHDVRALPSPQAETVFSAYNAFFRRMRALCLEADAVAGLDRNARNTRTHLLVSVVQTMRVWIDRYEPADYPRVGARVADLVLNGLAAPGSAWPPRLDLALPASEWAPTDAFLRAATILINEQGYRGASVEKISAHLRVTKGSFYHHNDNKDDLVANCFARTFERIRRTQDAAEAAGGTGWERLGAATATLVAHQLSEAGPLLRWIAVGALPDGLRADVTRTMHQLWERVAFPIADGIADGSIRPCDPSIAAQVVNSTIDAASELDRWSKDIDAAGAQANYVYPLLAGLYAPPPG
ncbi:TetR/AcrR family transcriptional regulator [Methylobacterium soli]|uniref:TetR/AcrR family transcriptional regulator n=1 Tax=Methylobacterium soli TaxID=553447 RepID=A0A6L3SU48_9HYPH|nr:TetR/AcrR family transcriptional regulator [Methylobacterium soli]KAB1076978.1 TetR/AcrR family transcriptional regulator [Methylobacterium soli]GJE43250.1 HTH-type transcriptional regulator BetI [Methylobacterium soli]